MFELTMICTFKWWKITELPPPMPIYGHICVCVNILTHPLVNPHGPADLVVGDGDALGLEELLEGEHGREHARVPHRSWNSGGNYYRMVN